MNITICGGGNLGHVLAGFLAVNGDAQVNVLTRRPELWADRLEITDPYGEVHVGHLATVSANPADVIPQADMVFICLPGFSIREELEKIRPYLGESTPVGTVVSSTGFFFQAFEVLPASQPLFGFQRVPFIARTTVYGHSAQLLGYKPYLNVAVEQSAVPEALVKTLEHLFHQPIILMGSHYEVSLSNSNPILHTGRLYALWHDNKDGESFDCNPDFYGDWTDEASQLLIDMDAEFQQLLTHLPVRHGAIQPLLKYYESADANSLTRKISSIAAFRGLKSPMTQRADGRWVPDFASRYFTEDFPYGLKYIHTMAHAHGVPCPTIDRVYEWGISKCPKTPSVG